MKKLITIILTLVLAMTSFFSYGTRVIEAEGVIYTNTTTAEQNQDGDLVFRTSDATLKSLLFDGAANIGVGLGNDDRHAYFYNSKASTSQPVYTPYPETTEYSDSDDVYFVITKSALQEVGFVNGEYTLEITYTVEGESHQDSSNTIALSFENASQGDSGSTVTDPNNPYSISIEEVSTGDDAGLYIYGDSAFLNALVQRQVTDDNGQTITSRGVVVIRTGSENISIANWDNTPDYLARQDDRVYISKENIILNHVPNTGDGETYTVELHADGYSMQTLTLSSLTVGALNEKPDYSISQDSNGDIVITSTNVNWLRGLGKPWADNVGGGYVYLMGDTSSGSSKGIYAADQGMFPTLRFEETSQRVVIPYEALLENGIPENFTFNYIGFYPYGYVSFYKTSQDNFSFTVNKGVKEVPTDISVKELDNGDIEITSNDEAWLAALGRENHQNERVHSYVDVLSVGGEPISSFTFGPYDFTLQYSQGKVIIKNQDLINRGIENGDYTIKCYARNYSGSQSYSLTITKGLKKAPTVTVSCEDDKIILSSVDTDWIRALYDNSKNDISDYMSLSYIQMGSQSNGDVHRFGSYSQSGIENEIMLSSDGKSVYIPADVVAKKGVVSGQYLVSIRVPGYNPVRMDAVEITTSIKILPTDIQIVYNDKGLVITSADTNWLAGIYNNGTADKGSYIKLKRNNQFLDTVFDYSYESGSEYIQMDGSSVYIPIEYLEGYTIQDNYYVVIGSKGYRKCVSKTAVLIGDVKDVPLDLRILQNDKDEIEIHTNDTAYLTALLDAASSLKFYLRGSQSPQDGLLIATGNAGQGTVKGTVKGDQIKGDPKDKYIVIPQEVMIVNTVSPGHYEIILDASGYCKATSALNVVSTYVTVNLFTNGGRFQDGATMKTIRAKIGKELSLPSVTNADYEFAGWKKEDGSIIGEGFAPQAYTELTATWSKTESVEISQGNSVDAVVVYDDTASGSITNQEETNVLIVNTSTGTVIVPAGETATIPETNNALSATTNSQLYNVVEIDPKKITSVTLNVTEGVNKTDETAIIAHAGEEYKTENAVYFEAAVQKQEAGSNPETVDLSDNADTRIQITITLPDSILNSLSSGFDRVYKVIHVKKDGTETLNATVNGDQLSFVTDSLSPFAVVYKDTQQITDATVTSELETISFANTYIPGNEPVKPEAYAFYYMANGESGYTLRNDLVRVVYNYCDNQENNISEYGYDVQIDATEMHELLSDKTGADAKLYIKYSDNDELHEYRLSDLQQSYYNESNSYTPNNGNYTIRFWCMEKNDIYDARIIYQDKLLSLRYSVDDWTWWDINWNPDQQPLIDSFMTALYEDFNNTDFVLKYSDSQGEHTVSPSEFGYGNFKGMHGNYYEFASDSLFVLTNTDSSLDFDSISSVYTLADGTRYDLLLNAEESTGKQTVYKVTDETAEFGNDQPIIVEYVKNGETYSAQFNAYEEYPDNRRVLCARVYYDHETEDGIDPDYNLLLILSKEKSAKETSLISVANGVTEDHYELWHNEDSNEYHWTFYKNPIDYFNNVPLSVLFTPAQGYSDVVPEQIIRYDGEEAAIYEHDPGSGKTAIQFKGRDEKWFMFAGKVDEEVKERQTHIFHLDYRTKEALNYTFVSGVSNGNSYEVNWYNFMSLGKLDEETQICANAGIQVNVAGDTSALSDFIRNLDDTDHTNETIENNYYNIVFREGTEVLSKSYSLVRISSTKEYPTITYTLQNGDSTQQIQVRVIGDAKIVGDVFIDGQRYNKWLVDHEGSEYTVYTVEMSSIEARALLETVGYDHNVLVARTYWENLDGNMFYEDGYFYIPRNKLIFELYYPDENYEFSDSSSLADLNKISSFGNDDKYITVDDYYMGSVESEAMNMVKSRMANPIAYLGEDGTPHMIVAKTMDEYEFVTYSGEEPILYYGLYQTSDGYYGGFSMAKVNKPTTFVAYDTYGVHQGIETAKTCSPVYFAPPASGSASEMFEKTIADLADYVNAKIVLTDNITLDKDVLAKAFRIMGAQDNQSLTIDLNGYSINTNGYKIELPVDCIVQFVNTADTASSIIGTGETVIKSYGRVYTKNIEIRNNNGIGITIVNDCIGLDMSSDTTINAKTGIKIIERENGIFNQWNRPIFNINGKINASQYCVYVNCPTKRDNDTYRFWITPQSAELTSNDVGVFVNGFVTMEVQAKITAAKPFVVNGGVYNLRVNEITATNGDIILVDSDSANATSTEITISLDYMEGDYFYKATGSIVRNQSSSGKNTISKVKTLTPSAARYYFDYSTLFAGVQKSVVEINGGYYLHDDVAEYLDPYSADGSDPNAFALETVQYNGTTYYRVRKPSDYRLVSNIDELREALQNKYVTFIEFANSIDAGTVGEVIDFTIEEKKYVDMKGFTLSNTCLNARTASVTTSHEDGKLQLVNGTIRNECGFTGVVLNGAKLQMSNDVSIIASSHAIILKNGLIDIEDGCSVMGNPAILIDIDQDRENYYGRIDVNGSKIIGLNGPAIRSEKTYRASRNNNLETIFLNTKIGTYTNESLTSVADCNAIEIVGQFDLGIHDGSSVIAGQNGIIFDDDYHSERYGRAFVWGSSVESLNGTAVHLSSTSQLIVNNESHITAKTNAVELYETSMLEMYSGYIKGGEKVFKYLDDNTDYRRQDVRGGYFSEMLTDRSVCPDTSNGYRYVCVQTGVISGENPDPYPYVIATQDNPEVNAYKVISNSIERKVSIDEQHLENAVDAQQMQDWKDEGKEVNIILTVEPENNEQFIEQFPNDKNFTEYYSITMNVNVGGVIDKVDEVDGFQLIRFSVNKKNNGDNGEAISGISDLDKLVVYHRHANDVPVAMTRVDAETGMQLNRECFFISEENGSSYINIVTKRFSTFAFADGEKEPEPVEMIDLNEVYSKVYEVGIVPEIPQEITIGERVLSTSSDISILYEGTGETEYSGNEFPTQLGTYMVTWSINSETGLTGSASHEFRIVEGVPVESLVVKANLTFAESTNINFYIRNVPAENAPMYTLTYSFDGVEETVNVSDLPYTNEKGYKAVIAKVYSYQMWSEASVSLDYNNGASTERLISNYKCSVKSFLNTLINSSAESEAYKEVYKKALDYGAAAQLYFTGRTYGDGIQYITNSENLVNKDLNPENVVNAVKPEDYDFSFDAIITGLNDLKASLIFGSTTSIKLKLGGIDKNDMTVTCVDDKGDSHPVSEIRNEGQNNEYVVFNIMGLRSYQLHRYYLITINKGTETMNFRFSPYTYANQKWDNSDESGLVQAMVAYGDAAENCWDQ